MVNQKCKSNRLMSVKVKFQIEYGSKTSWIVDKNGK